MAAKEIALRRAWLEPEAPFTLFELVNGVRAWVTTHRGWIDEGVVILNSFEDLSEYLEGIWCVDPVIVCICRRVERASWDGVPLLDGPLPIPSRAEAEAYNSAWTPLLEVGSYTSAREFAAILGLNRRLSPGER